MSNCLVVSRNGSSFMSDEVVFPLAQDVINSAYSFDSSSKMQHGILFGMIYTINDMPGVFQYIYLHAILQYMYIYGYS